VEVPYEISQDSVRYVADELREMVTFIEDQTHRLIAQDTLRSAVNRSREACSLYLRYLDLVGSVNVPGDVTSQMYEIMTNICCSEARKACATGEWPSPTMKKESLITG
jgi:benzoyl-CoA reductase/2-hydroxyglutaryl-CoA dehydratase subunit BcrC/BadD/HgdB